MNTDFENSNESEDYDKNVYLIKSLVSNPRNIS